MHIYIQSYIHTNIHTQIPAHTHTPIHTYFDTQLHTYAGPDIHTCMPTCTHTITHRYRHICTYITSCFHVRIPMYISNTSLRICVYVYKYSICVHMTTLKHTHANTQYPHTYTHTYIHSYMHAHAANSVYIPTYIRRVCVSYVCLSVCVFLQLCVPIFIHKYVCTQLLVYVLGVCIDKHIHIHI